MDKEASEFFKQWHKEHLDKKKIKHYDGCRSSILFGDTVISEGGWCGTKWMSAKELDKAETRWVQHSYETGKLEPDYNDWIAHQCGGCSWFAALDSDYGICCNKESPNDGRITFEHGGCANHSYFSKSQID